MARPVVVAVALAASIVPVVAAGASRIARVQVSVGPRDVLLDARVRISVSGLRARERVTLEAITRDASGRRWIGQAVFHADPNGRVDVAQVSSRGGTYRGRDAMGLFWSMRSGGTSYFVPARRSAVTLRASIAGRPVASARLIRAKVAPEVDEQTATLTRDGLFGRFFARPNSSQGAAVLLLGGSGGGLPNQLTAQILASRGIPTLALAYFGKPGLPRRLENIPLEYFQKALRWLGKQPEVNSRKVAILGSSRGAEAALLIGSTYPGLVRAVIAYSPSSVVNSGFPNTARAAWTLSGKPVSHVSPREWNDPTPSNQAAIIRVERIPGPVLLVSGAEDALWVSGIFAEAIASRRRALEKQVTSLVFPASGHGIGTAVPNLPLPAYFGGTAAGDARARARAWPNVLGLLKNL